MHITCRTLWLPKDGNSIDEYEDAAAPNQPIDDDFEVFRCAVADGATETSFSQLWANLLVQGYLDKEEQSALREKWQAQIPREDLPWYAEQKANSGAFAALAGLNISTDGRWDAATAGDSCIFQSRNGAMIKALPIDHPDQFNNRPALLCSKEQGSTDVDTRQHKGDWLPGDKFLLLTDAAARWLLLAESESQNGVTVLWSLENTDDFRKFVDEQRANLDADGRPKLLNDDLTVMMLEINSH